MFLRKKRYWSIAAFEFDSGFQQFGLSLKLNLKNLNSKIYQELLIAVFKINLYILGLRRALIGQGSIHDLRQLWLLLEVLCLAN